MLEEAKKNGFRSASAGKLVSWIGVRNDRHFELDLAHDGPHVFVAGPTGSGKSQLLRLLLRSLTARYDESRLAIFIADFKGSALLQGLEISPWIRETIDDLEPTRHAEFWQCLAQELESRELALKKAGRSEFDTFEFGNRLLLLVVDEVAAACRSSVRASELLAAVAARGRSLGIFLVAANQGMSGVPRELLLNLRLRIALAGTDQVELVQLGAQAGKLLQVEANWIAARAISHASDDRDFVFPLEFA
jgi:S-DNA-T family DNA segregation ATPase FtsK/SpoIIIE